MFARQLSFSPTSIVQLYLHCWNGHLTIYRPVPYYVDFIPDCCMSV